MAFTDQITIHASSGKGGDGVVRWLRTKESARGGPSGGDGGRGGDVVLLGVRDITALSHYRYEKKFHAEDGEDGKGELKHGANGADTILKVPIGTVARIVQTGDEYEITKEDEHIVISAAVKEGWAMHALRALRTRTRLNERLVKEGRVGISN